MTRPRSSEETLYLAIANPIVPQCCASQEMCCDVKRAKHYTRCATYNLIFTFVTISTNIPKYKKSHLDCSRVTTLLFLHSFTCCHKGKMATTSSEMQNLLDSPAMAAPPRLKHNFVMNTVLCVDFGVCFIVSAVAVVIRMWIKVRLIRKVEI